MKRKYLWIIIMLASCSVNKVVFEFNSIVDPIVEIDVFKEEFSLSMEYSNMTMYFPKKNVIKLFDAHLAVFVQEIDEGRNIEFNTRMYTRYAKMKQRLVEVEVYEILNPDLVDSLNDKSVMEKADILDENIDLGFRFYFKDVLCQLLEKGEVGIKKDGSYLEAIIKNSYTEERFESSYSSVLFTTRNGKRLCECPPYIQLN